jgi:hypothetical protein
MAQGSGPESESKGFVVRKHKGRQAKPGFEPVVSSHSATGFDGNAQILKPCNVALHRAGADFESHGEFRAAHLLSCL